MIFNKKVLDSFRFTKKQQALLVDTLCNVKWLTSTTSKLEHAEIDLLVVYGVDYFLSSFKSLLLLVTFRNFLSLDY